MVCRRGEEEKHGKGQKGHKTGVAAAAEKRDRLIPNAGANRTPKTLNTFLCCPSERQRSTPDLQGNVPTFMQLLYVDDAGCAFLLTTAQSQFRVMPIMPPCSALYLVR